MECDACEGKSNWPPVHPTSLAFLCAGLSYNPRMRTGALTALIVGLCSVAITAQSVPPTEIGP
jgi:hypothetical protein